MKAAAKEIGLVMTDDDDDRVLREHPLIVRSRAAAHDAAERTRSTWGSDRMIDPLEARDRHRHTLDLEAIFLLFKGKAALV